MWLFKCEKAYSTPRLYATTFYFVQFSFLQSISFSQPYCYVQVGARVFGLHFRQYNYFHNFHNFHYNNLQFQFYLRDTRYLWPVEYVLIVSTCMRNILLLLLCDSLRV